MLTIDSHGTIPSPLNPIIGTIFPQDMAMKLKHSDVVSMGLKSRLGRKGRP